MQTKDIELNRAIASYAPTWGHDATALAHLVLYQTGQAGPTVNNELLERTIVLAQEALDETSIDEPEPEPQATSWITFPSDRMLAARIRKALDRQYDFSGRGVCTLGQRLQELELIRRSWYVQRYARHKRNGCHAELKHPRTEYTVWYMADTGYELGVDVPKIVYDALFDLPKIDGMGRPQ